MAMPPQLRVQQAEMLDTSAEHFFDVVLPGIFETRGDAARTLGGRIGFIVDDRQWIVDLDYARVRGDRYSSVVADDDALDVVVRVSAQNFASALSGRGKDTEALVVAVNDLALKNLQLFLAGVTR